MNRTEEVNECSGALLSVISGNCERCGSMVELTPFDRDGINSVVCVSCRQVYDKMESVAFVLSQVSERDMRLLLARRIFYINRLSAEEDEFNQE